jgi:hypothetical protein
MIEDAEEGLREDGAGDRRGCWGSGGDACRRERASQVEVVLVRSHVGGTVKLCFHSSLLVRRI